MAWEEMKRFLTGAVVMAIVGAVAYFIVLFFRQRKLVEVAQKNMETMEYVTGVTYESKVAREEKLAEEVSRVAEMQVEEVMDAWETRFGR